MPSRIAPAAKASVPEPPQVPQTPATFGNAFEVLGLSPAVWVDREVLKKNYLERAAILHPDAVGGNLEAFQTLRAAMEIVSSPSRRIRELFRVFSWTPPIGFDPPGLESLFSPISKALQDYTELSRKCTQGSTGFVRVARVRECRELIDSLQCLGRTVRERMHALDTWLANSSVQKIDPDPALQSALWTAARELTFLEKWELELSETEFLTSELLRKILGDQAGFPPQKGAD